MTGPEPMRGKRRNGFTLVELLVVMGVVLVLMTLAVAFVPRVVEQQRVTRGASQLQGWLLLAKQWALRDQSPRGLRLNYDTYRVTTLNYIEQPDDWTPGGTSMLTVVGTGTGVSTATLTQGINGAVDFAGLTFVAGSTTPLTSQAPVQAGDYLEFKSGMGSANLAKINSTPAPTRTVLYLNVDLGAGITVNANSFSVVRAPRLRTGEAPLQLPADTAIDLYPNSLSSTNYSSQPVPSTTGTGYYDILFSPSGGVIATSGAGTDLHLWVIDTSLNPTTGVKTFNGQQIVVTVNLRSGFISTHLVDTTLDPTAPPNDPRYANPYSYTQDGKTSGF